MYTHSLHIYSHICAHTCTPLHALPCMHAPLLAHRWLCTHTHTPMHTHTNAPTHHCMRARADTHTYTHIFVSPCPECSDTWGALSRGRGQQSFALHPGSELSSLPGAASPAPFPSSLGPGQGRAKPSHGAAQPHTSWLCQACPGPKRLFRWLRSAARPLGSSEEWGPCRRTRPASGFHPRQDDLPWSGGRPRGC